VRWVYPKTVNSYDALIDEFGDDITGDLTIARPSKSLQTTTEELHVENQNLKEEIAKIHKTLELITGAATNGKVSEIQALQSALAAKESELAEIRHRTQNLEKQLEDQHSGSQDYFKELQRLRAKNQELERELEKQLNKGSKTDKQQWIKETVKASTGRNEKFCLIAERLQFNATLPIELVKELECELRRVLNCNDQNVTLRNLITQANDAGILTPRGLDLAHTIRKQRNIVAHEATDRTLQVRILLCLFAAALLWTEFAE
jgi:chromosome segregation ATPase